MDNVAPTSEYILYNSLYSGESAGEAGHRHEEGDYDLQAEELAATGPPTDLCQICGGSSQCGG